MDQELLIWLFAGAYSLIGILFVMIWHHVIRCKGVGEDMAVIRQIVSDIRQEIGNHESGIIGQLHRYSKSITRICAKIGVRGD
jgi:hypothetical protein